MWAPPISDPKVFFPKEDYFVDFLLLYKKPIGGETNMYVTIFVFYVNKINLYGILLQQYYH